MNCRRQSLLSNVDKFLMQELNGMDLNEMRFQQDGATCPTARETIMLHTKFLGRGISCFGDINWSSRSYDLTYLDYFLWGLCEVRSMRITLRQLRNSKEKVHVRSSSPNVLQNFAKRMHTY